MKEAPGSLGEDSSDHDTGKDEARTVSGVMHQ